MAKWIFTAVGMMSGTSMDGIDVAALRTDGERIVEPLASMHVPWGEPMRGLLRAAMAKAKGIGDRAERPAVLAEAEEAVTESHVAALRAFIEKARVRPDIVGFHGQTVLHAPARGITVQLGDGRRLARALGIPVVWDMRAADVAAGGQGAPLVPAYHAALAGRSGALPAAFINIGGVANVTWVGEDATLLAFDCGPGNAPIDDWMQQRVGLTCDTDGMVAAAGKVREEIVRQALAHPFFHRPPPKSLDRDDFTAEMAAGLDTADGAATLTAITAHGIAAAAMWFPQVPARWIVCGGGRHNPALMRMLAEAVPAGEVVPVETLGFNGDMIEAQCWAYLAVRSLRGLPVSWPETTGVPRPLTGGVVTLPEEEA